MASNFKMPINKLCAEHLGGWPSYVFNILSGKICRNRAKKHTRYTHLPILQRRIIWIL